MFRVFQIKKVTDEEEFGEAGQNQLNEKCPLFPSACQEEREKEYEDSFQNAGVFKGPF